MRKKIKVITEEQWIEVLETSFEFMQINYEMAKKINISDIIKKKMAGGKMTDKNLEFSQQIDDKLPRLCWVLADGFGGKFPMVLSQFNAESQCKVTYSIDMLFNQLMKFVNNVIKNKENGYKGYKFEISQTDKPSEET